jgi:predicted metal-dependent peptidase
LIYFTDGVGEKELKVKPINYKTIWVLTSKDNLSLNKNYGVVTRLEKVQVEGYGYDYGLQAVRDAIHDWAR